MTTDGLREDLARELATWRVAGWASLERAARFHRRVRLLARLGGLKPEAVYADLQADVEAIEAESE